MYQRQQTAPNFSRGRPLSQQQAANQDDDVYGDGNSPLVPPPAAAVGGGGTNNKIDVVVRARPFLEKELAAAQTQGIPCESTLTCLTDTVIVDPSVAKRHCTSRYYGMKGNTKTPKRFAFDAVLGPRATQNEVYSSTVRKIALDTFNGKNGSVLAYGATGSGKTHTMVGTREEPGIVYQVMADILRQKEAFECMGKVVTVKVAHYEIYNELVHDLLVTPQQQNTHNESHTRTESHHPHHHHHSHHHQQQQPFRTNGNKNPAPKRPVLQVQETADGAADLPHLKWHQPQNLREFEELVRFSTANRATGETAANEFSSRSHAILTIEIETRQDESSESGTVARLKLCDLAGSERAAANRGEKKTFKEGANINKSLLALGAVVQALATKPKSAVAANPKFIPYRGSKLTRLLKDCLGGNCNTVMMVCVTGHHSCLDETNNTLNYAMYAKKIEASAKTNDFSTKNDALRMHYQKEIEKLQQENEALKEELKNADMGYLGGNNQRMGVSPTRVRHSGGGTNGGTCPGGVATTTMVDASTDCFDLENGGEGASFSNAFFEAFLKLKSQYDALTQQRLSLLDVMGTCSEAVDGVALAKLRGHRLKLEQVRCGTKAFDVAPSAAALSNPRHKQPEGPPSAQVAREEHMISVYLKQLDDNAIRRRDLSGRISDVDEQVQHLFEMITCKELEPFNKILHKASKFRFDAYQAQLDLTGYQRKVAAENSQRSLERDLALEKCVLTLNSMSSMQSQVKPSQADFQTLQFRAREALVYTRVPTTTTEQAMLESARGAETGRLGSMSSPDMAVSIDFRSVFQKLPAIHQQLQRLEQQVQQQQHDANDCSVNSLEPQDQSPYRGHGSGGGGGYVDPLDTSVNSSFGNAPNARPLSRTGNASGQGFRQRWKSGGQQQDSKDPHTFIASLSYNSALGSNCAVNNGRAANGTSPTPKSRLADGASSRTKSRYTPGPDVRQQRPGAKDASAVGGPSPFHRSATSTAHAPQPVGRNGKENRAQFR